MLLLGVAAVLLLGVVAVLLPMAMVVAVLLGVVGVPLEGPVLGVGDGNCSKSSLHRSRYAAQCMLCNARRMGGGAWHW